ncbi:MAG: prepilin-type N-terminal cleavage/methylation domain-containing protein [Thermogutta sp.]
MKQLASKAVKRVRCCTFAGSNRDGAGRWHAGRCPLGFTLLEVVIVLVLVVILSGLAFNALMRPMAARRLQLAADQIRAEWIRARNRAMADGQTYCFQCELGGNGYLLIPYDASWEASGESLDLSTGGLGSPPIPTMQIPSNGGQRKELPEKITFADLYVEGMEQLTSSGEGPISGVAVGGDTSILFFPDGTTSSALVTLENEFGRRIDISLRGLTGAVLVGDLYDAEGAEMSEMPASPSVAGT